MNNLSRKIILFYLTILLIGCNSDKTFESSHKKKEITPWTNLNFKDQSENFSFAIVSDNSGGHRPGVFNEAVLKINQLSPNFVMSVGDLIDTQDFNLDSTKYDDNLIKEKWLKLNNITKQLKVPFFYVAGNNDIRNTRMESHWFNEFGSSYYYFKYKNTLFVTLNSEDPPGSEYGEISKEQMSWLETTLQENNSVRWTFIFLHRPMWLYTNNNDWQKIEKLTKNRSLTVFAGHHHTYSKATANEHNYYGLATTGGASSLEFSKGQFDHFTWVSMSDSIPKISNILLNGLWGDNPTKELKRDSIPN